MKNYLIVLFFLTIACKNEEKKQPESHKEISTGGIYLDKYHDLELIKNLSNKILVGGDTVSFNELKDIYILSSHKNEFLYYSIIMGERYKYTEAYMTTFFIMKTDKLNKKNIQQNKIANYYLLKAYEGGNRDAFDIINERFLDNKLPKSKDYWDSIN